MFGIAKAVALPRILHEFGIATRRAHRTHQTTTLIDRYDRIGITVEDEQWHTRQLVGVMNRRSFTRQSFGRGPITNE